ncbi:hypothetical protein BV898_03072 [Hypsibius exemplaris]|uniref:Uncharacterized protein n=1 Tax=Hypsibius exemplaris TaxID=2072580 RepID=A0A1W0X6A6_HYPEX|nr:hypothetical protein BV898_03072 [Hypsibius exemplaris]
MTDIMEEGSEDDVHIVGGMRHCQHCALDHVRGLGNGFSVVVVISICVEEGRYRTSLADSLTSCGLFFNPFLSLSEL